MNFLTHVEVVLDVFERGVVGQVREQLTHFVLDSFQCDLQRFTILLIDCGVPRCLMMKPRCSRVWTTESQRVPKRGSGARCPMAGVEAFRSRVARTAGQGHGEALLKRFDGEDGVIGEVNFESSNVRLRDVRHRLARHAVGDAPNVDAQLSHCDHPLRFPRCLRPNALLGGTRVILG